MGTWTSLPQHLKPDSAEQGLDISCKNILKGPFEGLSIHMYLVVMIPINGPSTPARSTPGFYVQGFTNALDLLGMRCGI